MTYVGLPSWRDLLEKLYKTQHWRAPTGSNYTQQAEDFKNRLLQGGKSFAEFRSLVRNALYDGVALDFATIRRNPTLAGIGALVSHSLRGQVSEVFTLNFDDILERYLRFHGIIAKPVIAERFWAEPADLLVHHPHGFLPSPGSPYTVPSSFLVFDERSYVDQNPDSRWNQRIEVAMQAHICLFVGLGHDMHLKQLVARTVQMHAFSPAKDGYWGIVLRARPKAAEVQDWAQYHVHVESLSNYSKDLPSLLFSVCQEAAKFP
jgi:SIR2-like domain